MVLDDLRVEQLNDTNGLVENTPAPSGVDTRYRCVIAKQEGNCKANFTRYYYSLTSDACVKVRFIIFRHSLSRFYWFSFTGLGVEGTATII